MLICLVNLPVHVFYFGIVRFDELLLIGFQLPVDFFTEKSHVSLLTKLLTRISPVLLPALLSVLLSAFLIPLFHIDEGPGDLVGCAARKRNERTVSQVELRL